MKLKFTLIALVAMLSGFAVNAANLQEADVLLPVGVNVAQPAVAKVGGVDYATLTEAFAAVTDDNQTVVICKDVTENLTGAYLRGNITTENDAKVTITLTNSGQNYYIYCPYTFVLGKNVTLNVPNGCLFYYAGGTIINGKVVTNGYYQRYAGTKLTINEPGSMTVTSETCIIRYMDEDDNAGIYINGDNNDATVGLNLSVAYFYQGTIYAKDANIKTSVYWQTNDTDNQGSANLVLDNSKLVVTGSELEAKATGNSTVTLKNNSVIDARYCGFTYDEKNTSLSIDATSKIIIGKNGELLTPPVAKIGNQGYATLQEAIKEAEAGDVVELLADVTVTNNEIIWIRKSVTINGNDHTVTSNANRVFRIDTGNVEATFNNVNIVSTAFSSYTNDIRGISVDNNLQGIKLTLNNCSVDFDPQSGSDWAYAVNIVGGSGYTLTINGGTYEGANVINVWGDNHVITIDGATLTSLYNAPQNGYYGQCVRFEGTGCTTTIKNTVFNGEHAVSVGELNSGANTVAQENNTDNTKLYIVKVDTEYYQAFADAFAAAVENGETIEVLNSFAIDSETFTVAKGKNVTLNLNGRKITVTDNKAGNNTQANYELFYVLGEMTVTGNGTIELTATNNREWNASSSIFHNRGGVLNVENGTFKHLGGTDMAFVIDNSGNWAPDATTNVKGGEIASSYIGIRNRMDKSDNSGKAILNVSGGKISGTKRAIWAQASSSSEAAPAKGEINVSGGEVGLIETARNATAQSMTTVTGGTVEAFKGEAGELKVTTGGTVATVTIYDAAGNEIAYAVADGLYIAAVAAIEGGQAYATFAAAYSAAQAGNTIELLADVKLTGKLTIAKSITIDGNGHSIIADETGTWWKKKGTYGKEYFFVEVNGGANATLKNICLDSDSRAGGLKITSAGEVTLNNVHIKEVYSEAALIVSNSQATICNEFSAEHIGNGIGINVSSKGNLTVAAGTKFEIKTTSQLTQIMQGTADMSGAVDADGNLYFVATNAAGTEHYSYESMNNRTADYTTGLTILADIELTNALNVTKTLELNGHSVISTVESDTLPADYASLPNLDDKFVIGKKPTAIVNNLGSITVAANDYKVYDGNGINNSGDQDMPLSFVMQFLANQSEADMAASPFAKWYGDFVITFTGIENDSFIADGCYLAGHYGSFGWVKVPVDGMVIEEGVRYPVMLGVGMGIDYKYICSDVEDFKCALYLTPEILAANPNIKVKLELGVVDSSKGLDEARDALVENEKVYSVTDYEYDAEDFECPLSGEGTEASPFLIKNVNDLILFRNSVNSSDTKYNADGVYVALDADIDLAGVDWSVNIGDNCNFTFDGIFDGKNHKIKNLTATETAENGDGYICSGLFGAIYGNAVVKNLTIENVTINAPYAGNNIAAVVGFAYSAKGSIENVNVIGDININAPKATGVGAIVGYGYESSLTIKDCEVIGNDGSEIAAKAYVGGVIGYSTSKNINTNTVENVKLTATGSVGAVAGIMLAGGSADGNTIKNVSLSATGELWANSAAVVAGTISGGSVTVANTSVENVTANGGAEASLVGGDLVEKPTAPIAKVEAKIGNKYYATLEEALKADGNEVELLVPITVPAGKEVTLDLNGKTVSQSKACTASYEMINNKGDLTIKNGTLSFTDTSAGDPSFGWGSYTVRNEGTLVVENATIEHLGAQEFGKHMICAIFQYSGSTTINGGTISTPNYRSVRLWKGDMTINGGTFDGQVWVQAVDNSAKLTIDGGTFEPNGRDASSVFIGNVTEAGVHYAAAFSVTDGTFNGKIGCNDTEKLTGDLIAGGTFSATAKENTNVALLATGYVFESNANGTFGVTENPDYISELTLVDGQFDAYDFATDKTVGTFTYKRTFSGLNWNAFYVPFEIEMSEIIENYDIAYINDVNSYDNDNNGEIDEMKMEVIKITDENATLQANHPYLIRPKNEEALAFSITLYDVTLFAAEEVTLDCTSMYTKFEVTGSYIRRWPEDLTGQLVLSGAGEWITMTEGYMNPCRLILKITSREGSPVKISTAAAKSIRIVTRGEIDGTTGIEGVEYESTDAIYDLSGRRVNEITKAGVYVVNGKKVLVK